MAGVLPELVPTDSQFPPEVVLATAVKATGVSDPFTAIGVTAGVPLLCVEVNNRVDGVTVGATVAGGLTASLTVTCWLLATPAALIVTKHGYGFCTRPAGLTETLKLAGVLPLVGLTVTQLQAGDAVKGTATLALSVLTANGWAAGVCPPTT